MVFSRLKALRSNLLLELMQVVYDMPYNVLVTQNFKLDFSIIFTEKISKSY